MTDIKTRLRNYLPYLSEDIGVSNLEQYIAPVSCVLIKEAADHIEEIEAERDTLRRIIAVMVDPTDAPEEWGAILLEIAKGYQDDD